MSYFPVDDDLTYHPKVIAAGNAAIGVWTRAGAWAKKYATGGFVSQDIAHGLGRAESRALVKVGMWEPGEHPKYGTGYWFHDWEHQAGNFDGEEEKARLEAKREADRERQRRKRYKVRESDASHAVTPPRIASPSSSYPSSLTDVNQLPRSSPDPDVRAEGIDHQLAAAIESQEAPHRAEAKRLGFKNIDAAWRALQAVTQDPDSLDGRMTLAAAVELAKGILGHSKTPVLDPDAYIAAACRKTPQEIREGYFQLDIGAVR